MPTEIAVICLKPPSLFDRWVLRPYLKALLRWVDTDIAAERDLMERVLPARIREHERVASHYRTRIATLED